MGLKKKWQSRLMFFVGFQICVILLWQDFKLTMYNPEGSSTSKNVTCDNSLCEQRNQCPGTISSCPYSVSYVSAQTSTSGVLVEDVLHLTREDNNHESVEAYVTFGLVVLLFCFRFSFSFAYK